MSIPVSVQFTFGKELPDTVKPDDVITSELKDRISKLLTGKFNVDAEGRCVLDPSDHEFNGEPRDSVCVGANIGPISVSYCKDIK